MDAQLSPRTARWIADNFPAAAVPLRDLGLRDASKPLHVEFKWADNVQQPGQIEDFAINGDAAPNGRFNYIYSVPGL